MVRQIDSPDQRAAIARQVLEALPDWFGIPEIGRAHV